jgi:cytochrome b involved in lipid metabolism
LFEVSIIFRCLFKNAHTFSAKYRSLRDSLSYYRPSTSLFGIDPLPLHLRAFFQSTVLEMSKTSILARARNKLLSRRQIEGMIADNQLIVIVDDKVLKLDAWVKFHPGGDLAIQHMVGKDATDEVNA